MKILFIGSVEFSLFALKKIIEIGGNVVGVCTLKKSSFNADFYDLTKFSNQYEIPSFYVNDINSQESIKWISNLKPDVIFCFGWSKLLGPKILSIASKGVVGFHPAALPANRGRHPIIWALALGLKETASTFFLMDESADGGDILSQAMISIDKADDARSLYDKITTTALIQIEKFVPDLINEKIIRIKQDNNIANFWRKRSIRDGLVDWRMGASSIYNLVRALSRPYVGAEFSYDNVNYKLWKTEIYPENFDNVEPGKIIDVINFKFPVVKCGIGAIKLIETEPKFVVSIGDYL